MAGAAVLVTKIEPPALRAGHVPRARLVERLRAGDDRRLTLVIAPAGSGKSTLLAEWRAATTGDAAVRVAGARPGRQRPGALLGARRRGAAPGRRRGARGRRRRAGGARRAGQRGRAARSSSTRWPPPARRSCWPSTTTTWCRSRRSTTASPSCSRTCRRTTRLALASRHACRRSASRGCGPTASSPRCAADALRFRDDEAAALLNGTLALDLPAERPGVAAVAHRGLGRGPLPGRADAARRRRPPGGRRGVLRQRPAPRRLPGRGGARRPRRGDARASCWRRRSSTR